MLTAYVQGVFLSEHVPTVFDNTVTTLVVDGQPIRLNLWDTAGQEEYKNLRPLSYPMTVRILYFNS